MSTPETPEEFINIHQALNEASLEARQKAEAVPYSLRLHPELLSRAKAICKTHGTDLSAYLRKCAEALVADYSKP